MYLKYIQIVNFRNLLSSKFQFDEGGILLLEKMMRGNRMLSQRCEFCLIVRIIIMLRD